MSASLDAWRIAIAVDPSLPRGLIANTVATLGIGLGAARPALGDTVLTDAAGRSLHCSANRPVPILQARPEALSALLLKASPAPDGAIVAPFPRFARSIQIFDEYLALFATRDMAEEAIEGVGLAGPDKWVRSLTGSLKLLR